MQGGHTVTVGSRMACHAQNKKLQRHFFIVLDFRLIIKYVRDYQPRFIFLQFDAIMIRLTA